MYFNTLLLYLRLVRPKHWIKNVLIFAPLFFSGNVLEIVHFEKSLLLFVAFSLLASSVYIINDINDYTLDKMHPKKKFRPIASGKVNKQKAAILAGIFLGITVLLSFLFPITTSMILLFYLFMNLAYTFYFKYIPLADIFVITIMYLIRAYAGGSLFDIYVSHWLILCTFFLALFLITAKRRAEFNVNGGKDNKTRVVLVLYNKDFLDHMLTITTTATLVCYSLYVISINKPYIIFSTFIAAFGIFRYLYLAYQFNEGESPEALLFNDKILFLTIVVWGLYMLVLLYKF